MRRRHPPSPSPALALALSFLWALLVGSSGVAAEIYLPKLISSSSGATLPLKRFDKVRVKTLASEEDRSKIFQLSAHALARDGNRTCSSCRYLDTVLEGYDDIFTILELGVGNCEFLRGLVGRGVRARGLDVFPTLVETYCSEYTLNGTVLSSLVSPIVLPTFAWTRKPPFMLFSHLTPFSLCFSLSLCLSVSISLCLPILVVSWRNPLSAKLL